MIHLDPLGIHDDVHTYIFQTIHSEVRYQIIPIVSENIQQLYHHVAMDTKIINHKKNIELLSIFTNLQQPSKIHQNLMSLASTSHQSTIHQHLINTYRSSGFFNSQDAATQRAVLEVAFGLRHPWL